MKDWRVHFYSDRGHQYYRYRVSGENLNRPETHPDRWFSWEVPTLDEDRYDMSNAQEIGDHDSRHWGKRYNAHRSEALRVDGDMLDAADNTGDF